MSSIDWAQSSLTNFSPMITREFEQDSNATIVAVADASLSTRCGVARRADRRGHRALGRGRRPVGGVLSGPVRAGHLRRAVPAARRRRGRGSAAARDLLPRSVSDSAAALDADEAHRDIIAAIESHLRKTSLVPVISDFLFPDAGAADRRAVALNAVHDVFLMMADVALRLSSCRRCRPAGSRSSTWRAGSTRVLSRRELRRLAERVEEWQDEVDAAGARRGPRHRPRRPRSLGDGNGARGIRRRAAAAEDVMSRHLSISHGVWWPAVIAGLLGSCQARRPGLSQRADAAASAPRLRQAQATRRRREPARSNRIRSAAGGRPIARAVRVGERFRLVLTCGVIETDQHQGRAGAQPARAGRAVADAVRGRQRRRATRTWSRRRGATSSSSTRCGC